MSNNVWGAGDRAVKVLISKGTYPHTANILMGEGNHWEGSKSSMGCGITGGDSL